MNLFFRLFASIEANAMQLLTYKGMENGEIKSLNRDGEGVMIGERQKERSGVSGLFSSTINGDSKWISRASNSCSTSTEKESNNDIHVSISIDEILDKQAGVRNPLISDKKFSEGVEV